MLGLKTGVDFRGLGPVSRIIVTAMLGLKTGVDFRGQGRVARSTVSANHWLSGIKTYKLSWYLTWVSVNHASSNSAQRPVSRSSR